MSALHGGRGTREGGTAGHLPDASRFVIAALAGIVLAAWYLVSVVPPAYAFGSSEPPPIPSVDAAGYMTCGIMEDGSAACWGADDAAGDPNAGPGMATPPAGVDFLVVNGGYGFASGVTTTDSVVCWGNDAQGQVSDAPAGDTFEQLTVGIRHACGLRPDGSITCWGSDAYGEISGVPAGSFNHVKSGNFDVCAIRSADGTVDCWGRNAFGQSDDVPAGAFAQVNAGFGHVCGLRPDGTILCWGRGTENQTAAPTGTYTHVSTGTFHVRLLNVLVADSTTAG